MIVLFNPLSTTPGKQPLPLSVAAKLADGNVPRDPVGDMPALLA